MTAARARTLLACGGLVLAAASAQSAENPMQVHSQARYVHRINLYDKSGKIIDPASRDAAAYSAQATCGRCHNYSAISSGHHWNATRADAAHGRPGQPWIIADERTATQIPVSYRPWPNVFSPGELELDEATMLDLFGRHMPGGGPGESHDGAAKWAVTGNLEVDCFVCHAAETQPVDRDKWIDQLKKHNYAWASLAAAELGRVSGAAKDLPEDWDPDFPPIGMEDLEGPSVQYDRSRFDADGKVFLDLTRHAPVENCMTCHSFRQVGEGAVPEWQSHQDIHIAQGLRCTDCHSNGIIHEIVRGFEGESAMHPSGAFASTLTCAGCHIGASGEGLRVEGTLGGTHAAPNPGHEGIPPLHFASMSCTSCHSGPWPEARTTAVQTSMAHSLGIASTTRVDSTPPHIVEPVFLRDAVSGKIAPHRMMHPQFWAWLSGDVLEPLLPEAALKAAPSAFPAKGEPWDEARVVAALEALAKAAPEGATAAFVALGKLHVLEGGKLAARDHAKAAAVTGPIGLNVRPAAPAIGSRGCMDCHSSDAPMMWGEVSVAHGVQLGTHVAATMIELRGDDARLHQAWALSFKGRSAFKVWAFAMVGLVGLVLLSGGTRAVERLGRRR